MKLLGFEFERFACFERVIVPLSAGVNVLVGKNNSGKTAILRGLTALEALPIENAKALRQGLAEYLWKDAAPRKFLLHTLFELENGDTQVLSGPERAWQEFIEREKPKALFSFEVWPENNQVGISGFRLVYSETQLDILERSQEGWTYVWYDPEGRRVNSARLDIAGTRTGPDGRPSPIVKSPGLFHDVGLLRQVRLVDAHRVVMPELQLQTVNVLPGNADTLPQFLQTLQGTDRGKFAAIERFLTAVFPEFEYVNAESADNRVFITLTLRRSGKNVRLTHCGTGVEQILILSTFVLTSPPGTMILLDEPHSYLHPSAERALIDFLHEHQGHRYLISTHSPVLMNSVAPQRIICLSSEEAARQTLIKHDELSGMLHQLGYRNSDFLFNDQLVFVEGESDTEIFPVLLENSRRLS